MIVHHPLQVTSRWFLTIGKANGKVVMSGFWDTLGRLGQIPARAKAGEQYQKGFRDARAGRGKDPEIISMKASASSPSVTPELAKASFILTDAYEEGYRDGLAREEMELRTKKNIRFED